MTITKEGVFVSDEKLSPENYHLVKQCDSVGHLVFESLDEEDVRNSVVFVDVASGREWKGSELKEKILSVSCALIDLYNFKKGTCVCIDYDHTDHTVILALAIVAAGGLVACAFPKDPYAELLYLAKKVGPQYLFCHQKNLDWGKRLSEDLNRDVVAIAMDGNESLTNNFQSLLDYDYTKSSSKQLIPVACDDTNSDISFIIMSSGTTGQPKAILVTHSMIIHDMFGTTKLKGLQVTMSCTASLDYVSGRLIVMGAIRSGYKAIIMNGFEPETMLKAIEKYKINVVFLGAAAFYNLMTYEHLDKYDISSLIITFPMGAKITYLNELKEFLHKHPHIKFLRQGFGTSESSGVAVNKLTPEEYLACCDNCGKLMMGYQAKIVDPLTGKLLGPNERGLIRVKGPTVFPGYYDVSRTACGGNSNGHSHEGTNGKSCVSPFLRDSSTFDEDGFYITGDIAYFNEKEELFIVGRQKELLCCRGAKKVLPDEIEVLIQEHPAVLKVCVLGIPNKVEVTLHCPRAFVVPTSSCYDLNAHLSLTQPVDCSPKETLEYKGEHKLCKLPVERRKKLSVDIMEFLNERIGWEKQLTGGIVLIDEIPTLRETGKMNKNYLRSLKSDQIEIYGDRSE